MTNKLNQNEIKILRNKKRVGYVFSILTISFGLLFNIVYFLINKTLLNCLLIGILDIVIILFAYLICNKVNHKINLDLKSNKKVILKKIVEAKSNTSSYKPGSGVLYMPILTELFPKLRGKKMRKIEKYIFIANNREYEVDKETYHSLEESSTFYVHVAEHSGEVLNVVKPM